MLHMHGNIPYMFDYLADLVVHLLLLKSLMAGPPDPPPLPVNRVPPVVNLIKHFTIVIYDSRVLLTTNFPNITTLES